MFLPSPLSSRNQLASLLNEHGLLGHAVEIGTHRGDFARIFLDTWNGERFDAIDPWSIPFGYEQQALALPERGSSRNADYKEAMRNLFIHRSRVHYLRSTSIEAAQSYSNQSLDFVYIDGDHSFDAVYTDLRTYGPLIKPGGIIAGHDWICPGEPDGGWGMNVQSALLCFLADTPAYRAHKDVYLIVEEGGQPWTFYLFI